MCAEHVLHLLLEDVEGLCSHLWQLSLQALQAHHLQPQERAAAAATGSDVSLGAPPNAPLGARGQHVGTREAWIVLGQS